MMRNWMTAGLLAVVAACTPAAPAAPTAEEIAKVSGELNAWLDAEYEEDLLTSPIALTFQGRKEHYGEIDPYNDAEIDRKLAWLRASVAEMQKTFDPAKLNEEAHTSFDLWAKQLDYLEKSAQFRRTPYVFVKDGPHVFLPNFVISFHAVADKSDMEAYISRLNALGRALDQVIESAKLAAAEGNHAPRFAYDQSIQEAKNVITGAPFGAGPDSPLWADAKQEIATLLKDGKVTADEAKALQADAEKALKDSVKPVYERIIAWLEADRPNSAEQAQGAGTLMKDGAAFYNTSLELQTTTPLTAAEIHEIGLKEVARIHGEMEKIKEQVGFKGTLQEFFAFMRTDKQFQLPNNDAGRAQYIKMSEDYLGAMKAKLPEYFGILPKADLVVKRVEAFREEPGGAQHYFPSTPDGSRPGVFYAHLSDMKAMPTYTLEAIAYHEGAAGPSHADRHRAGADGHSEVPHAVRLDGLPGRLGAVFRDAGEGHGLLQGSVFRLRPPWRGDLARDPAGGGHRHSLERLERGAGGEVLPRQRADAGGRGAVGSAPLYRVAGAGDGLQDRHAENP